MSRELLKPYDRVRALRFDQHGLALLDQRILPQTTNWLPMSDADAVADPEMGASDIDDLIFYMQHLAPPPRTRTNAALEAAGEQVFQSVGCAKCHVPELSTESGTPVPLYSDLLLHDVLPAGANGIVEGMAGMRAFRTSPLWGLAKSAPYMHDGRAFTVQDAILAHDGEAAKVRQAFEALPPADRDALIAFLKSL